MPRLNKDALVDKLCERLAVETANVEIYQALIARLDDPMLLARLKHFTQDEIRHCHLLSAYVDKLGVTNHETPSVRLAKLEGQAYLRLIAEASTAAQLLNILLTVELSDENAWEMLINLGRDMDDEEMVQTFNGALKDEKEHLRGVRGMLATITRQAMTAVEESSKQ
jgi:rubrerythrin